MKEPKTLWNKIKNTKMIELSFDCTSNKIPKIPIVPPQSIVKINLKIAEEDYKLGIIDRIIKRIKSQNVELVFTGKIIVQQNKKVVERKGLVLNLNRKELILQFIKSHMPPHAYEIETAAIAILEKTHVD